MNKNRAAKLKAKIIAGHVHNTDFAEVVAFVQTLGFVYTHTSGSHLIFSHPSITDPINLQPAKDGKAKDYQVRQIRTIIKEHNL